MGTNKIGDLTQGMHSCIGSARPVESNLFPEDFRKGVLQNRLNGLAVRLDLPTMVIRSIILDSELDVHKGQRKPL
jgi:hypothetical protein